MSGKSSDDEPVLCWLCGYNASDDVALDPQGRCPQCSYAYRRGRRDALEEVLEINGCDVQAVRTLIRSELPAALRKQRRRSRR